jgi:serine protease Do
MARVALASKARRPVKPQRLAGAVRALLCAALVPAAMVSGSCTSGEDERASARGSRNAEATLLDLKPLIDAARPAVVSIRNGDAASGTGFIVHPEGYVLTARHVVQASAAPTVVYSNGTAATATVVAADDEADIALLRIDAAERLPSLPLSAATEPNVGQWIVVLGNPFGLGITASTGIVGSTGGALGSASTGRMIQTDAAINPGNSGGPVIDLGGEVVAIATARIAIGQGLGFVIPIARARALLESHLPSNAAP